MQRQIEEAMEPFWNNNSVYGSAPMDLRCLQYFDLDYKCQQLMYQDFCAWLQYHQPQTNPLFHPQQQQILLMSQQGPPPAQTYSQHVPGLVANSGPSTFKSKTCRPNIPRKSYRFYKNVRKVLEREFVRGITTGRISELAPQLNLTEEQILTWFMNRCRRLLRIFRYIQLRKIVYCPK